MKFMIIKISGLLSVMAMTLALAPLGWAEGEDEDGQGADQDKRFSSGLLSNVKLRGIGPALMSGCIADIAIDPSASNTWYVAAGSGNVWKTINVGTTWTPIFENYGSYSIGCVAVDPSDSDTVWVGTGENVGGRHMGFGDGIYKSTDGGDRFTNVGLKQSEHLSKIVIHPEDSNTVYVASRGPLWSPGGERGLLQDHGRWRDMEPDSLEGRIHRRDRCRDGSFQSRGSLCGDPSTAPNGLGIGQWRSGDRHLQDHGWRYDVERTDQGLDG